MQTVLSQDGDLRVTALGPGSYRLRTRANLHRTSELARESLRELLLADGAPHEQVSLTFVGEVGFEEIFELQPEPVRSLGWEGLLLPYQQRRTLRLPRDFTVTPDASRVDVEVLRGIHRVVDDLATNPYLDLQQSMLIHHAEDVVGWVPIWRMTPGTSIIRFTVIHPSIHADEERRRTHLRLAAYSQAVESQCAQGRSVLSWLPDTGDPVNDLKLSIGGAASLTHWKSIKVRRDLQA